MDDTQEARIEHLKLLQNTVTRMANASAAMKRYCLIISAAALGLAAATKLWVLPLIAAVLCVIFWAADAMYLRQEHWFRNMFDQARQHELGLFVMTPDRPTRDSVTLGEKIKSWSTAGIYGPLCGFLVLSSFVLFLS